MGVGQRLKEMRSKAGMTQKDLADELHVTYQAVSRWENDDAEPSFDTVKEICRIFHCTSDDLFGIERDNPAQPESTQPIAEKPQVVEKVIIQEAKPVLGVCEQCNKPIYDPEDLHRIDVTHTVRHGPSHHTTHRDMILCSACNEKRLQQKKAAEDQKVAMEKSNEKKRRVHSFVWPTLSAILFLVIAIVCFVKGYTHSRLRALRNGFCLLSSLSYADSQQYLYHGDVDGDYLLGLCQTSRRHLQLGFRWIGFPDRSEDPLLHLGHLLSDSLDPLCLCFSWLFKHLCLSSCPEKELRGNRIDLIFPLLFV